MARVSRCSWFNSTSKHLSGPRATTTSYVRKSGTCRSLSQIFLFFLPALGKLSLNLSGKKTLLMRWKRCDSTLMNHTAFSSFLSTALKKWTKFKFSRTVTSKNLSAWLRLNSRKKHFKLKKKALLLLSWTDVLMALTRAHSTLTIRLRVHFIFSHGKTQTSYLLRTIMAKYTFTTSCQAKVPLKGQNSKYLAPKVNSSHLLFPVQAMRR